MNSQKDEIVVIRGPLVPTPGFGGVIYSITLENGYVVTSPAGFGEPLAPSVPAPIPKPLPPV